MVHPALAAAQDTSYLDQVSMKDLVGDSSPAVLNTNPFYGAKNLFSDVQGRLIFNPLGKVQFYLGTMNEKGAETLKLLQIAPDNAQALTQAFSDYQQSVIHVQPAINRFLDSKSSDDSAWNDIANDLLVHLQFTDDLMTTATDNTTQAVLVDAKGNLQGDLVNLLAGLNHTQAWVTGVAQDASDSAFAFSDLRIAERLRDLGDAAALKGDDNDAFSFQNASENLFADIATRIKQELADGNEMTISDLSRVSGAPASRLQSIMEITSLEPSLASNKDLKNLVAKLSVR